MARKHNEEEESTEGTRDLTARGDKGKKAKNHCRIKEMQQKFIYCDDDHCTYYHPLFFDTKTAQYVMPDGHYCSNGDWVKHEDVNDTDMLVQKPSATPEGKDLREAFGRVEPIDKKEAEEQATAH